MTLPAPPTPLPFSLMMYRAITRIAGPLFDLALKYRAARGKEDEERMDERKGESSLTRPNTPLIWIHGASVGESLAVLPLIHALLDRDPDMHILMTTGTVTSAALMEQRLPHRARHQFVPVDRPPYVERFLDYWQPDLALWVESEFWPNLMIETYRRDIPMALINARISDESFARWEKQEATISHLLSRFTMCLATDEESHAKLRQLGAHQVTSIGNLKFAAEPLPANEEHLAQLRQALEGRPCWLAASTHEGEELLVAKSHRQIQDTFPGACCLLVPRHPERGPGIANTLLEYGMSPALRSAGQLPTAETDIYIADTLGELGMMYRLAPASFIGGSWIPHGGQNPLEAARLNSAILHGPHVFNFESIYCDMDKSGASYLAQDETDLAEQVVTLLQSQNHLRSLTSAASHFVDEADQVVDLALDYLSPLLPGEGTQT